MDTQELWTNEMIYEWSNTAKVKVLHKNRISDMVSIAQAEEFIEAMRDEYEAKLAAREAPAMERVPDGRYSMSDDDEMGAQSIIVDSETLSVMEMRFGYEMCATAILPDGWQLMRPKQD